MNINSKLNKKESFIVIKIYEPCGLKRVRININNSKDRTKLKHIIKFESYKLKRKDKDRLIQLLKQTKI